MGHLKGLAVAIAAVVSVADPAARDRQAIAAMLDALDRGQAVSVTVQRPLEFHAAFETAATSWINAVAESDRQRRRDVVAVAVLESARDATLGVTDFQHRIPWTSIKRLIEWQCDRLRRSAPTEFERRWMIASAAVSHASGDARFLTGSNGLAVTRTIIDGREVAGGSVPCTDRDPCNHAGHIESRFPGEPQVALARVMLQTSIARKPGSLAGRIASSKLIKRPDGTAVTPALDAIVDSGLSELRRLSEIVTVGWDARLRLGLALYGLNQRPQSLHELEQVAASPADLHVRYVAHFASALNHDAGNHLDQTITSLEAAQALLPGVRSTATLLAAKYVIAGRHAEAHALMEETYLAEAPGFDPRGLRVGAWAVAGPLDQLREMIHR
jgi:hypothetical protein